MKKVLCLLGVISLLTACSKNVTKVFLTTDLLVEDTSPYLEPSEGKRSECDLSINYAPDVQYPEHTPMRYIATNFHFMRNEAWDNTYSYEEAVKYCNDLLGMANYKLKENPPMNLPKGNNTPALPFKYKFVMAHDINDPSKPGVYFHQDDELTYFIKKGKQQNKFSTKVFDKYGVKKGDELNVFFQEHHPDSVPSPTYKASGDGVGFGQWIKVTGAFQFGSPSSIVGLYLHEAGHTLGLPHSWGHDGCDDTPTHPNCWDNNGNPPCNDVASNNMMDYNNCQCALSPCQLGKIHFNFAKEGSNQRGILDEVWCTYKKDSTITIGSFDKVTWNGGKDLEGDLVINNGGQLRIKCLVSFPSGAKIVVKPKGTLILDGADITNRCNENWEGIEIWQKGKNRGKVVMMNGASLHRLNHSIVNTKN